MRERDGEGERAEKTETEGEKNAVVKCNHSKNSSI